MQTSRFWWILFARQCHCIATVCNENIDCTCEENLLWKAQPWWQTTIANNLLARKTRIQQMHACKNVTAHDIAEQILMHECHWTDENWTTKIIVKVVKSSRMHVDSNWTRVCASENFTSTKEVVVPRTKAKDMKWCRQWWEHVCHLNDEMTTLKEDTQKWLKMKTLFSSMFGPRHNATLETRKKKNSSLQEQHQQICWQLQSYQF